MGLMTDFDYKQTQQIKEEYFYHLGKNAQYKFGLLQYLGSTLKTVGGDKEKRVVLCTTLLKM